MPSMTTPSDDTSAGRFEFWREAVGHSFVPLEALPREVPDFRASLHTAQLGAVQVSVVAADPHGVAHTRKHIASDPADFVKVSLQLAGRCMLTQADRQALLEPGELAIYDTRHPYTLDFDQPYRTLVLMFPRVLLRLPDRDLTRMIATTVSCGDGLGPVVHPFLYGLAGQVRQLDALGTQRLADSVVDLVGAMLSERCAVHVTKQDDGRELLARRILTYMEQRLSDPGLGPDRIAAAHHISRRFLYKLLAERGYTVSGWLRERRLAECLRDLADPALAHTPVATVGSRWGFPDPAHFSHAFRSAYGMSPSEARSQARGAGRTALGA
ncbi:helix-turn-helix domain-containing protein [Streptomyces plumbiresistens]